MYNDLSGLRNSVYYKYMGTHAVVEQSQRTLIVLIPFLCHVSPSTVNIKMAKT